MKIEYYNGWDGLLDAISEAKREGKRIVRVICTDEEIRDISRHGGKELGIPNPDFDWDKDLMYFYNDIAIFREKI